MFWNNHLVIFMVATVLLTLTHTAMADLISPQQEEAHKRFVSDKNLIDRTDQFCIDHTNGKQCNIPGTPFSGGGNGTCNRKISSDYKHIDLMCEVTERPMIEWGIPDGPYQADKDSLCPEGKPLGRWVCNIPPRVSDRFCNKREVGQICQVELNVAGVKSREEGTCQTMIETQLIYKYGRQTLTRPVLYCKSKEDPPEPLWHAVSPWKKLLP